jgi:hypothetical protein
MDEYQTSSVIQWYEELEERLIEFLKFVPFIPQNLNVSSPRLAGVISETCNILDSLFRECLPSSIAGKIDIVAYANYYAGFLSLPTTKSFVFVSPPIYLTPFEKWSSIASGGNYITLPWWSAYTKLKHSRIKNIKEATLRVAIEALCGLHQTIALLPDLVRTIIRHEWLQLSFEDVESTAERLERRSPSTIDNCLVESKLFAVPIGSSKPFPDDIADFRPLRYRCSERMVMFMGKL